MAPLIAEFMFITYEQKITAQGTYAYSLQQP